MKVVKRSVSRANAFILCFQKQSNTEPIDFLMEEAEESLSLVFDQFCKKLIETCQHNTEKLDEQIAKHLHNWDITRISKVSLVILRLALSEILFFDDIPKGVSANEYVELAKEYAPEEDISFINGVIGSVIKSLEKE